MFNIANKEIKILFVTRESLQLPGARYRAYQFSQILKEEGIDSSVLSYADDLGAKSGKEEHLMSSVDKIRYNFKAFHKIQEMSPNIIFIQRFNYHSLSPWIFSLLNKRPYILDLDDWEFRDNISYYGGIIPRSKAEFLTSLLAHFAYACSASSHYLYDYLKKRCANTILLPAAIDLCLFSPNKRERSEAIKLAWIGTIFREEDVTNLEFILKIYKKIKKVFADIVLEIVGDGLYLEEVKKIARKEKIDTVKLRGWLPFSQIPHYLTGIDIGLVPLFARTRFQKAKFPVKILEFMAMKIAVISSAEGEANYIIKDGYNGLLAHDEDEFVEKLYVLIKDQKFRQSLGENARRTVEQRYSYKAIKPLLLKLINESNFS